MRIALVIYNPVAAQGKAGEMLPAVRQALDGAGIQFEIVQTQHRGHAVDLADEAARAGTYGVVVAAGGDGTANEVINGLMRARSAVGDGAAGSAGDGHAGGMPALGLLCVGRGNDFAHGVGVPHDLDQAISVLAAGDTRPLDVGLLHGGDYPEGRYFGNGIGVGFDTIVGFEAAKLKRVRGFAAYLVGAIKTLLFYYETPLLDISTDSDAFSRECILVSIMNGRRLGGAFFMAPEARTDDGVLDLCIAGAPRRGEMLGLLLKYMKGTQATSSHIMTGRTRGIRLVARTGAMAVHADGETICTAGTDLAIQCIPSALRIVTRVTEATAETGGA